MQAKKWSEIVKKNSKKPPDKSEKPSQPLNSIRIRSSKEMKERIDSVEKRTIILRRGDPEKTVSSMINDLVAILKITCTRLVYIM